MKKSFISIMVIALMTACTNQETIESVPVLTEQSTVNNNIRSYEDALKIAQSSIAMLESSKASSRGISTGRKIDLNKSKVVTLDNKTRSDAGIKDTLIYVFNFENNEGFSLISASKNTVPILAVTEKGYYDVDEPSEVEGFNFFMDMAKQYVYKSLRRDNDSTETLYEEEYVYTYQTPVGPYITVRWGQHNPEGEICPNNISGCGPTAIAQVMSYYEYPESKILQYDEINNHTFYQNFNWTSMKAHSTQHSINNCLPSDTTAHKSISRLCREIGYQSQSDYDNTEFTDTQPHYMYTCLQHFNYSVSYWNTYYQVNKEGNIDNNKLMIFVGERWNSNNERIGHYWVLDGYQNAMCTVYLYSYHAGDPDRTLAFVNNPFPVTFYHFNWGWYGICNGYFYEKVFNILDAQNYDTNSTPSPYTEERDYYMNVNILTVYR